MPFAVVAAVAEGIAAVGTAIGAGVAGAVGAIGTAVGSAGIVGAAAGIGEIAGPAILGAGIGAAGSAITGGNPLVGALTGGLTGGLGAAGAGEALGGALGIGAGAGNALIGAGVGALGQGLSGGNPLLGAVTGGVGGYLTGGGGTAANGSVAGSFDGVTGNTTPTTGWGNVTSDAAGGGGAAAGTAASSYGPTSTFATDLNPQSALSRLFSGSSSSSSSGNNGNNGNGNNGNNGNNNDKSLLDKLISNPGLALGALSGVSSLFNKPQQSTAPTPGPASNAANLGPLYNTPLNRLPPASMRQYVDPNVANYYTYGQMPGQQFFQNNNLRAFGFATGGPANDDEFNTAQHGSHVQGPGTGTSDSIPAMLSDGEYVLTAKEVSALGGGSNDRGAQVLDHVRKKGALSSMIGRAA